MKCQILFSVENKKNISKCCLLKILPRKLSVNTLHFEQHNGIIGLFDINVQIFFNTKQMKWNVKEIIQRYYAKYKTADHVLRINIPLFIQKDTNTLFRSCITY